MSGSGDQSGGEDGSGVNPDRPTLLREKTRNHPTPIFVVPKFSKHKPEGSF
jgi:hypothetical protein